MMTRSLLRPDNRLYLGAGGSGKTWLALRHAEKFPRVLFIQPDDSERSPYPATRDRKELILRMMQPAFRTAFIVDLQLEEAEWANEAAWHAGDCLVIWEEAGTVLPNASLKVRAPFAFSLWMRGRHRRCRVFACSQRPASVAADLRANVARAIIFNMTEPGDVEWAREVMGLNRHDAAAGIARLKIGDYEAIDWQRGAGFAVKNSPFE
jgi:hypothetical protein